MRNAEKQTHGQEWKQSIETSRETTENLKLCDKNFKIIIKKC